ncbi:MAG: hypothetical protein AAGA68_23710 [Pseudomonadota bacterium]
MAQRTIFATSKEELIDKPCSRRRWIAARNLKVPRRQWPDLLATSIYEFEGTILCPNRLLWPIPDIDKILGEDPRWFSHYLEAVDGEPRRTPRLLERVRLIDLFFRIEKPAIARHFALGPTEASPVLPGGRKPPDADGGTTVGVFHETPF